jgi:hypothetical protein
MHVYSVSAQNLCLKSSDKEVCIVPHKLCYFMLLECEGKLCFDYILPCSFPIFLSH